MIAVKHWFVRRSGAALILSMWALLLLSAVVISWAMDINAQISLSGSSNRIIEAEAMACSGAEIALCPAIQMTSPNLKRQVNGSESYDATITGEGGRLNLNWLVIGEDPIRLGILRRYLESKGVDLNERERMVDCLLDWVEPGGLGHLNGAEDSPDYHPAHALLTQLVQVKKIKGWDKFTARPGWDDDFTVNSNRTGVDLAWASHDVLMALPGMSEPVVTAFLQLRRGPDGIDGTDDDAQFNSLAEVGAALGLSPPQFAALSGLVAFKDPVVRITSTGKSGNTTRVVQMVVKKVGNVPQMITWKEL